METTSSTPKAVVVHAGARDSYQLAQGLFEAGLLDTLFTDLYWPAENSAFNKIAGIRPGLRKTLLQRSSPGLPFSKVKLNVVNGLACLAAEKFRSISSEMRRRIHRRSDAALGETAGRHAAQAHEGLVTYSYYGFHAMQAFQRPAMLFQVHPHPLTVRRILQQELRDHPDCAESLNQEWELSLTEEDFDHLVSEPKMASRFLVASSFTKNSLVENGANPEKITVVPYGVDLDRFKPLSGARPDSPKLKLLFVGRINQRKGMKYLLEALKLLNSDQVHLTICGRVVDSLSLIRDSGVQLDLRPSVSAEDLVAAYQQADLFIFPSVAEGFAQVLLESLACGLPILSTTHTAAPDLITEGKEGFIVEPRRPDLLAGRLAWCLDHRQELAQMRKFARSTAEQFTWQRFRTSAAHAVRSYLDEELHTL